ncbi:putative ABC transporter permease [Subdoligranulum variabile]|uniref:Uncharacterized protein n=1 Tax=Subdoligranulum variabile DSM 15176 TaxID=411471 RepID=D1PLA6_9FIRM|nr:hypothetical protein [Subdoligranulum variabile]EFB76764.1 hypothetical protein SUBVAR_05144 [Subdoligranulum variabile DSM 15176]UWP68014.1 putative ABC transporter permease [Subdoligranulum variabile]
MLAKYAFLAWFGGSTYCALEVIWRGYSHWTMLVLAAVVFIVIGAMNEVWSWQTSLALQVVTGTALATALEFITGCIVNLWLGWDVWDYSDMSGNLMGQICPQYTLLWAVLVLVAILLDDYIRWRFFGEEKPHYTL